VRLLANTPREQVPDLQGTRNYFGDEVITRLMGGKESLVLLLFLVGGSGKENLVLLSVSVGWSNSDTIPQLSIENC
jgi:hypothetical protein